MSAPTAPAEGENEPKKVEKDGIYTLADGTPVRLKEGDLLPEGAEERGEATWTHGDPYAATEGATTTAAPTEERAKGAAPQNRAMPTAPEKREG